MIILKRLNYSKHLNIVSLLDYKLEDNEVWILMDYLPKDLMTFFKENKDNKKIMNEKFFKNIAHQILCGLNVLHSQQIIHRDTKLENILYNEKTNLVKIRVSELSLIKDYNLENQYTDVGDYPFKSPEILLGLRIYTTASDIWFVGCLLVQICTMSLLFGANDPSCVLKLIYDIFGGFDDLVGFKYFPNANLISNLPKKEGKGLIKYIKEKKVLEFENDYFYDLIQKMLCLDPTKRFTAKECLEHPWFHICD